MDAKTLASFEAKVDRSGDCHLWTAARHPAGHGIFWMPKPVGKLMRANRVALEMKLGRALAPDEWALHTCDVAACVKPEHLEIGTQGKNMADAATRDRVMHGSNHYRSKLTEQDVREIKTLLAAGVASQQALADRYGVSRAAISQIRRGRAWARVTIARTSV